MKDDLMTQMIYRIVLCCVSALAVLLSLNVFAPLFSLVIPLVYVGYIFVLGLVIPDFEYPYFFLDVRSIGYGGVLVWVLILLAVFVVLSYLMWAYDKLVKKDGKWKFDFSPLKNKEKSTPAQ